MNPAERSLRARLGAHQSWANVTDRTARTAAARQAAEVRFEKQAREMHPDASEEQVAKAAHHLRQVHYLRMALASAKARRGKRLKGGA